MSEISPSEISPSEIRQQLRFVNGFIRSRRNTQTVDTVWLDFRQLHPDYVLITADTFHRIFEHIR